MYILYVAVLFAGALAFLAPNFTDLDIDRAEVRSESLARQTMAYHQAALQYVTANAGATGTIANTDLEALLPNTAANWEFVGSTYVSSSADGAGLVATWAEPVEADHSGHITAYIVEYLNGPLNVGRWDQATGQVQLSHSAINITLPAVISAGIPDNAPVIVTQY